MDANLLLVIAVLPNSVITILAHDFYFQITNMLPRASTSFLSLAFIALPLRLRFLRPSCIVSPLSAINQTSVHFINIKHTQNITMRNTYINEAHYIYSHTTLSFCEVCRSLTARLNLPREPLTLGCKGKLPVSTLVTIFLQIPTSVLTDVHRYHDFKKVFRRTLGP